MLLSIYSHTCLDLSLSGPNLSITRANPRRRGEVILPGCHLRLQSPYSTMLRILPHFHTLQNDFCSRKMKLMSFFSSKQYFQLSDKVLAYNLLVENSLRGAWNIQHVSVSTRFVSKVTKNRMDFKLKTFT